MPETPISPFSSLVLPDRSQDPEALLRAAGALLDVLFAELPFAVMALDSAGNVRLWNQTAERMFGWTSKEAMGKKLPTLPDGGEAEAAAVRRASGAADLSGVRLKRRRKDGVILDVRLWTARVQNAEGTTVAMLGVLSDETALHHQEAELAVQHRRVHLLKEVAIAANEAQAIGPALRRTLALICDFTGWPLGHVLVKDEGSSTLHPSALWHVQGADRFEAFRRDTEARVFASGEGLPGTVLQTRRPAWIEDVTSTPNFPRRAAAQACGLRSALGFPLVIRDEVVAVLEFFTDHTVTPDDGLLELMENVGIQLGRVVERARAGRQRAMLEAEAKAAAAEAARVQKDKALAALSTREREVLRYVALGADNLKIAAVLGITERTVKAHVTAIFGKLKLENRTQAARFAWTIGFDGNELPP